MTGNNLNDFMDDMYYNPEKEICYRSKKYMVTGFVHEAGKLYTLAVYTVEENSKTLFSYTSEIRSECVKQFEKAKIFDGKTIYEAEKDIEVLFD